jgi:integrase/recombinase XerD
VSALAVALEDYLALRRCLGYKLERAGVVLADFVAHLDQVGAEHITVDLALEWALRAANPDSSWRAQRLGMVRCFARYLHAIDPGHEIPPPGLIHRGQRRPEPFLFAEADIVALMAAAGSMASPLRALTMETLIGLLAVTGLRVGEVIRLDRDDVDFDRGLIVVRNSKLGRSRHVPLHATTSVALRTYLCRRDELFSCPASPALFISTTGRRLRSGNLRAAFVELLAEAGLPPRQDRHGPSLGGLRHSFAVQTLLDWHVAQLDVGPRLPVLSTFLGHVSPASTYWYLSASPPLLAAAARRLGNAGQVSP